MGAFASPNRAGVMNSLPAAAPRRRRRHEPDLPELGAGALDRDLLHADDRRALGDAAPHAHDRPRGARRRSGDAARIGHLPPVSVLFASFLGYNPAEQLLGPHLLHHLSPANAAAISGPQLLPRPAQPSRSSSGLHEAFSFAIVACLIAAAASWSRGRRYVNLEHAVAESEAAGTGRKLPTAG